MTPVRLFASLIGSELADRPIIIEGLLLCNQATKLPVIAYGRSRYYSSVE